MKQKVSVDLHFLRERLLEDHGVFVHPSATVSRDAAVGQGTRIWHGAQVREGAELGIDVVISKDVYIDRNVTIGDRTKVQNGVSVYFGVTVEDDVLLGPHMTFTNDLYPRAFNSEFELVKTVVRQGASIGANATVVCGNTIGRYAMVGAGSVVTRDVPDFALVYGNPICQQGWVSKAGAKLSFDQSGTAICPQSGDRYLLQGGRVECLGKAG